MRGVTGEKDKVTRSSEASGPGEWGHAGALRESCGSQKHIWVLRLGEEIETQAGHLEGHALQVSANEESRLEGEASTETEI